MLGLPTALVAAETVRVATFNVSLGRKGPGVLFKNIRSDADQQIADVAAIIQRVNPDILLLNEFDADLENFAVNQFRRVLRDDGNGYPYFYAPLGNEGARSDLDLDGDGKTGEWADAFGFGRFPGSEGMALLSRFPIDIEASRRFSQLRWADLPKPEFPKTEQGESYFPQEVQNELRMSSKSHWDVPVILPDGARLHILASHPTPPVFDGVENLNGLRNNAEIGFWVEYLNGTSFQDDSGNLAPLSSNDFVILGDLNNDPNDGEGSKDAISSLLEHPSVFDPRQSSVGGRLAAERYRGANDLHSGDAALDTVEWDADIGNMRVDYVLPSSSLTVSGSGVFWPSPLAEDGHLIGVGREGASNHRMVWVDIQLDTGQGTTPSSVNNP